jgi:hypothetical protein
MTASAPSAEATSTPAKSLRTAVLGTHRAEMKGCQLASSAVVSQALRDQLMPGPRLRWLPEDRSCGRSFLPTQPRLVTTFEPMRTPARTSLMDTSSSASGRQAQTSTSPGSTSVRSPKKLAICSRVRAVTGIPSRAACTCLTSRASWASAAGWKPPRSGTALEGLTRPGPLAKACGPQSKALRAAPAGDCPIRSRAPQTHPRDKP